MKKIILSFLLLAFLLVVIPSVNTVEVINNEVLEDTIKVEEEIEETISTVGKTIRTPIETKKSSGIFLYLIALIAMGIVILFSIAVISQYKPPKGDDFIQSIRPRIVFDKNNNSKEKKLVF
jgi:t-SNARE complex subunit (syntaxin)